MFLLLSFCLLLQSDTIPFKAKDEFSVGVDLQFRVRSGRDDNASSQVQLNSALQKSQSRLEGGKHPYVKLKISLIKLSDQEARAKLTDQENLVVYNKKVKAGGYIIVDLGFPDELKDKNQNTEYNCVLMTDKKVPISRIYILIEKDGAYFVNGVKYGRF